MANSILSMEVFTAEVLLEVRDGPLPGKPGGGVARRAGIVVEGMPGAAFPGNRNSN
ncbi:MAG: hypothetical protein IH903_02070 [Proteobacteria bacterium]|nr:hypothetical protein [Pseudomonadota bacterium]